MNTQSCVTLCTLFVCTAAVLCMRTCDQKTITEYWKDKKKDWFISELKQNVSANSETVHSLITKGIKCKR